MFPLSTLAPSLLLLLAPFAAASAAGDPVQIPGAALAFSPPAGFVAARTPEPPSIWSGELRAAEKATARLDVFVVPTDATAERAELTGAARTVALRFLPE